jgi:hypothetical protein
MWFGQWTGETAGEWWGDASSPVPAGSTGGGWVPYLKGERKKRGLAWDRKDVDWEAELRRVYALLNGELEENVNASELREAVAPHAESFDTRLPPVAAIDFAALAADLKAARALFEAYENALEAREEEEAVTLLLLT